MQKKHFLLLKNFKIPKVSSSGPLRHSSTSYNLPRLVKGATAKDQVEKNAVLTFSINNFSWWLAALIILAQK